MSVKVGHNCIIFLIFLHHCYLCTASGGFSLASMAFSILEVVHVACQLLDLLQVDLLASGASLVWPRTGRHVSLNGFLFAFHAKNGEWCDSHLGFQVSFVSPWPQWQNVLIPLRLNLLNVCVYLHNRRSKFVYFVQKLSLTMNLGESWRPQGAAKNKNLFQSQVNTGKGDFTSKESLTSRHILNLQRLFNTCISLPVTLTGSEKVSWRAKLLDFW